MKLFVPMVLSLGLMTTTALADGDVAKGEQVFKKCMACHAIADTTNKVGPHVVGVVGRKVAGVEGYAYSTGNSHRWYCIVSYRLKATPD